jgi:hypothetical protein
MMNSRMTVGSRRPFIKNEGFASFSCFNAFIQNINFFPELGYLLLVLADGQIG